MELIKDMNRMGPAPTWERELAATAANLVLMLVVMGVLVFVVDSPLAAGVVLFGGGVYQLARLVTAWRRRSGSTR